MSPSSVKRLCAALPFLIASATFLVFLPVLRAGFVNWDDPAMLLNNPEYRGLGWTHLKWMFTTFYFGGYYPLSWLSLALDHSLWGMDPRGYHLTNLLLHVLSAVLFYLLGLRLIGRAIPGRGHPLRRRLFAAASALLFSLHPLRVESVAWLSERRDVLSGLFFLATVLFYLRERGRLAVLAYAASLLAKGSGVSMPLVLLVLDVYPLGRPLTLKLVRGKWPFLLLALAAGGVALAAQAQGSRILTLDELGLGGRLAQSMYCFVFYLWKTVLPIGLVPLYGRPEHMSLVAWPYLPAALLVVSASVALTVMRRRWPAAAAAWICYLAALAPLSGMFPNGPQIAADRYSYLACLGWPLLLGGGALAYCRGLGAGSATRALRLLGALGVLAAALGVLTWRQTAVWHDSVALWRRTYPYNKTHTLVQLNTASTYYNKGVELLGQDKLEEAGSFYREALQVYPAFWQAHQNLANLLMRQKKPQEAVRHYRLALSLSPGHPLIVEGLRQALAAP